MSGAESADGESKTWLLPVLMMGMGLISGFFKFVQIALLENFAD